MKKDITYACLFLLLLVIIFFSDAIFGGKVLAPLDILYKLLPWSSQAASDFQQSANPLLYDQVVAFYSWNTLIVEELKNKTLPLWNPYSFCGAPLLACGQTAVFYPLTVLHYMLKPEHSYLMIAIIKLMIAGFSTYLFLRQIYIPPLSALFGGVSFMFSGSIIATLGFPYTNASIFLPLLFFFSERMIKEANMKNFAPFSIIVGVQFLGGQPETSVCVLIALTVYFVLRIGRDYRTHDFRKRLVRKTSFYLGGLVSGFVLSAIQTLPFLASLRLRAAYSFRSEYSSSAGPWYEVIVFLCLTFSGIQRITTAGT